jgi:ABC-type antimicrobial peptide transport system permease subunit
LAQYVSEALGVLWANKTRSFLTILGLIIGVMAVIAIQILGSGMAGAVTGVLGAINDKSFTVFPNARQADFTRAGISVAQIDRAARSIPNVAAAIPLGATTLAVRLGATQAKLRLAAESDRRFVTTPVRFGSTFTRAQIDAGAHVCILLDTAYSKLKLDADPVGRSIRAGERRYTIVGVLAKPNGGIAPNIIQSDVLIPYTAYERDYARGRPVVGARFLVDDPTRLAETETATLAYFARLKHGRALYQTIDRKTFSSAVDGIFTGLTLIVALIGAVSLLVAGIGILNIMLVSVAERTREIGLRKAIGATRGQVLAQFFVEALLLSSIGCALGLILGLAVGAAVNQFALVRISGVVAPIPWLRSVLIATGFATLVTLAFGTYPAYRAAALDPIEALRYE